MSNALVVLETHNQQLRKTSTAVITFAKQWTEKTGGQIHALLIGHQLDEAAKSLQNLGVHTVHTASHADLQHYLAESYAPIIADVAKKISATLVAATSSSFSKDVLPRVSIQLEAGMVSDCLAIVDEKTFKRPMWAGNVIATVQVTSPIKIATVRGTEFGLPQTTDNKATITSVAVNPTPSSYKARFVSFKAIKSERPDVATAARIVSGGRGVKGPEGFKTIEQLADALQAGVGASRAVCDAGWVPNDLQIGQTGKIVAPDLYIAAGLSGAIQHLAGMKGSKVIVAINKDPEAPIFQVADYGVVGDLFAVIPEFIKLLQSH